MFLVRKKAALSSSRSEVWMKDALLTQQKVWKQNEDYNLLTAAICVLSESVDSISHDLHLSKQEALDFDNTAVSFLERFVRDQIRKFVLPTALPTGLYRVHQKAFFQVNVVNFLCEKKAACNQFFQHLGQNAFNTFVFVAQKFIKKTMEVIEESIPKYNFLLRLFAKTSRL